MKYHFWKDWNLRNRVKEQEAQPKSNKARKRRNRETRQKSG